MEITYEETVDMFLAKEEERFGQAVKQTRDGRLVSILSNDDFSDEDAGMEVIKLLLNGPTIDVLLSRLSLAFQNINNYNIFKSEYYGRPNWEILCSALRRILLNFGDSYFVTQILPVLSKGNKSTPFNELMDLISIVMASETLEGLNKLESAMKYMNKYLVELNKAQNIYCRYHYKNETTPFDNKLVELFATIKTWPEKEDFEKYTDNLEEGIISLFVLFYAYSRWFLVTPDSSIILQIFRALSEKPNEIIKDETAKELEAASKIVQSAVLGNLESGIGELFQKLTIEAIYQYVEELYDEKTILRELIPTKELREYFKQRFENGLIFIEAEET
jgi:hypothetical protein